MPALGKGGGTKIRTSTDLGSSSSCPGCAPHEESSAASADGTAEKDPVAIAIGPFAISGRGCAVDMDSEAGGGHLSSTLSASALNAEEQQQLQAGPESTADLGGEPSSSHQTRVVLPAGLDRSAKCKQVSGERWYPGAPNRPKTQGKGEASADMLAQKLAHKLPAGGKHSRSTHTPQFSLPDIKWSVKPTPAPTYSWKGSSWVQN